jgi:hypothetical protein
MSPILLTDKIEKSEIIETLRCGARNMEWILDPTGLFFRNFCALIAGEFRASRKGFFNLSRKRLLQTLSLIERRNPHCNRSLYSQKQQIEKARAKQPQIHH